MIQFLLILICVWCSIGFLSAFIDAFVYFRGLKHMIECHVNHKNPKIKLVGKYLKEHLDTGGYTVFLISFFVIYSLLGIFSVIALINDFIIFTVKN